MHTLRGSGISRFRLSVKVRLAVCAALGLLILFVHSHAAAQRECRSEDDCPAHTPYCINNDPSRLWQRVCSECASHGDCGRKNQVCDILNARCVDSIPKCNSNERCGDECAACPTAAQSPDAPARPYCEHGKLCVSCRVNSDCNLVTGFPKPRELWDRFCYGGVCIPCIGDRYCGNGCGSCGGETPYCYSPDMAATVTAITDLATSRASCVRCRGDFHCVGHMTCDLNTHKCVGELCPGGCPSPLHCYGKNCVQAYASSHCKFGSPRYDDYSCVDDHCQSNEDCPANESCHPFACKPGSYDWFSGQPDPLASGCQSAETTSSNISRGLPIAALCMLSVLLWTRRRRARLGPGRVP